jgi:hypothetical protein
VSFGHRSESFAPIRVSYAAVTIGVTKVTGAVSRAGLKESQALEVRLSLDVETEDRAVTTLKDIAFEVSVDREGEITLKSNEQTMPWKFLIRLNDKMRQMFTNITVDYGGVSIEEALKTLAFDRALAKGGTLRLRGRNPITGGDLPIASGTLPRGSYPGPDVRFVETVEQLAFIEKKTGVSFSIPKGDITSEVADSITAIARILKTGCAEYEPQPWVSVSPVEQAKNALETFASGRPVAMAIHFEGQVVPIFGTHVMLGPVTLFCDRTSITPEDLEDVRKQLRNANGESAIRIRLTPFENCPIRARYVNWLPVGEAREIRQLPMYQQDREISFEDEWSLPVTDVSSAVALLESWYDEDAEEQEASWKSIKAALDRDRLSDRKLFS